MIQIDTCDCELLTLQNDMSDRDAFKIRIVSQFRLSITQSRVITEYDKPIPQRVSHGMPVMRIAERFDCRNMHALLLSNRCDEFDIAHRLAITLPRADHKRLVRRRMVANGVDGNLLLICGAIAVKEPADHTAFTAIGRFEFAAGGDDGAEQIRMVRTDLQRTCGPL